MNTVNTVSQPQDGEITFTVSKLFEDWSDSFSFYELIVGEDGKDDLKILAVNNTFANLISADPHTLPGRLFSETCPMASDWFPLYVDIAKNGGSELFESYNQDLKKYLSALVFAPMAGYVAVLVVDRTQLWNRDQELTSKNEDLAGLFSSMTTGFCVGRILRDDDGKPVDMLFEMVNAAFELLEGFPTATLQGNRLLSVQNDTDTFLRYVDIADNKSKTTFTKHIAINDFTLEVVCFSQRDDVLVCIENNISDRIKAEKELDEAYKIIEHQNETLLSSIQYAGKIQRNLLPTEGVFKTAFADYSALWSPKDVVGGDVYWMKNFSEGSLLCVCDCTGHGTPGALLTMLVASTLDTTANEENYRDTAQLILELDKQISTVLNARDSHLTENESIITHIHDGCDLAIIFVSKDKTVTFSSSGFPVFVCNGSEVKRFKGQQLHIGEGVLTDSSAVKVTVIPPDSKQKFYVASDGLFDQIGGTVALPFGYTTFKDIILKNHSEKQSVISDKLWEAFEHHRGDSLRRDDVELVTFKP